MKNPSAKGLLGCVLKTMRLPRGEEENGVRMSRDASTAMPNCRLAVRDERQFEKRMSVPGALGARTVAERAERDDSGFHAPAELAECLPRYHGEAVRRGSRLFLFLARRTWCVMGASSTVQDAKLSRPPFPQRGGVGARHGVAPRAKPGEG